MGLRMLLISMSFLNKKTYETAVFGCCAERDTADEVEAYIEERIPVQ